MTTRGSTIAIGAWCAVPLLLALLAHASVLFVASIARASAATEAERQATMQAEQQELARQAAALRDEVRKLEWLLGQARLDPAAVGGAETRRDQTLAGVEELRQKVAELQHQIAVLTRELARLRELEEAVAGKRRSKEELEKRTAELRQEIARLQGLVADLQQQINQLDETLQAPDEKFFGGTERDALYVECEGDGARIMPDNLLLNAEPTPQEQAQLLGLARQKGMVFFLIRPDGIDVYLTYRALIVSANATQEAKQIDLGFDAVDADWKLKYEQVGDYYRARRE